MIFYKNKIKIPIYDVFVWIVLCDNVLKARKEFNKQFGIIDDEFDANSDEDIYEGMCSFNFLTGCFGLFLRRKRSTFNTISHEIFHLTHRILQHIGYNFDNSHSEGAAMLNGYLTQLILSEIKNNDIYFFRYLMKLKEG